MVWPAWDSTEAEWRATSEWWHSEWGLGTLCLSISSWGRSEVDQCSSLSSTECKVCHKISHWLESSSNYLKWFQIIFSAVCTGGAEAKAHLILIQENRPCWPRLRNSSISQYACDQSWGSSGHSSEIRSISSGEAEQCNSGACSLKEGKSPRLGRKSCDPISVLSNTDSPTFRAMPSR